MANRFLEKANTMASISSIAVSGMQAAQTQLQTAAHNIANLSTENFHRQEVLQTPQAGGGVRTALTQADQAGASLETDVVAQLQAKNSFMANLAVFKTSQSMAGALLDEKI
jgi:flagellar basal body rod protein FlgG